MDGFFFFFFFFLLITSWPSKLKIGAKSKKDPHIKVCGKRENVREAKDRIMSVLDTKSNRVTLKMDVSHTEHSHVIGKGGNNIKRVMEETGCHIHFPDSNRNNQTEKSNQVSIAGQPGGVEAARVKIRELLPLVLSFELPAIMQSDPSSPTVQHISQTYNLTVSFKPPTRLYRATGVVRGSQNNANAVKRGTALLLEHLAGSLASTISVTTHLDIAPQHHLFMKGRNGSNIKHITQRTGAQIHFPDLNSPQKKSTVYIQGTIESVCLARQYLMVCTLCFVYCLIRSLYRFQMLFSHHLFTPPPPPYVSQSVIVKSVERNAVNMYEARKFLLGLESNGVSSSSPSVVLNPTTNGPSPSLICPVGLDILASAGLGLSNLGFLGATAPHSLTNSAAPNAVLNSLNSSTSPLQTQSPSTPTPSPSLWPSSLTSFTSPLMLHPATQATLSSILLSGVPGYTQSTPSPPPGLAPIDTQPNGVPDCTKGPCTLNGHVKHPGSVYGRIATASLAETVLSPAPCDSVQDASGHSPSEPLSSKSSPDEGSDTFVEVGMPRSPSHSANGSELKQMLASCKTSSGKRQAVELLQGTKNSHLHSDCLLSDAESSSSDSPVADKRAPGSERAAERAAQQNERERIRLAPQASFANMQAFDYEQKKLLATKGKVTSCLQCHYWCLAVSFHFTSFEVRFTHNLRISCGIDQFIFWLLKRGFSLVTAEHYLSSSNYMDCIPSVTGSNGCSLSSSLKGSDLPELFSKLGLGKYTDVFQQQEIDLQTFLTLTDQDLKELGITTFGARRKMLLAISELNKNRRKLFEPPIRSSFLEGGASGRLSRQFHADMASVSGRW
uniref:SAM domain-containing protein n=1 Tax=Echeneis naucrates TaxID=173247 RepID=A0A665VCN4_ECHNA